MAYAGLGEWGGATRGLLVLACCKANHWSHGEKVNCVQPQSAHPSIDSNQICRGHCVSQINKCAKFGEDCIIRTFTTWVWNITLLCVFIVSFPFLIFYSAIICSLTAEPILTVDSSKCMDWRKEVPFLSLHYFRPLFGGVIPVKLPPKCPICWNPSQNNKVE